MSDDKIPHTCSRCAGQKVEVGVYTGLCFTCFERRWEEAREDGYTESTLQVVAKHADKGATVDNPNPMPVAR